MRFLFARPYASAIGPDFILMDNNAHAHVTDAYLEHETMVRMDWPA